MDAQSVQVETLPRSPFNMTWNKHKKQLEAALAASMRLLVLIRESLKREPGGDKTPLYEAVVAHANLVGMLLPDNLRMTQSEVDMINRQLGLAPKALPPAPHVVEAQLRKEGLVVLKPDGLGGYKA